MVEGQAEKRKVKEEIKKHFNKFRVDNPEIKRKKSKLGKHPKSVQNATLEVMGTTSPNSETDSVTQNDEDLITSLEANLLPSVAFIAMNDPYNSTLTQVNHTHAPLHTFDGTQEFYNTCFQYPSLTSQQNPNIFMSPTTQTLDFNPTFNTSQEFNQTISITPFHNPSFIGQTSEENMNFNLDLSPLNLTDEGQQAIIPNLNPNPTHIITKPILRSDNPTKPNPPILKKGPIYVKPSAKFITYFSTIDTDDSGAITSEELKDYLHNKDNTKFNHRCIELLIDMFDQNKDGTIDKKEFPALLAYIKNWDLCFNHLDYDKTGKINYQKMHQAIQGLGISDVSSECIRKLLTRYDATGGNEINFDNFIIICVALARFKENYECDLKIKFGEIGLRDFTLGKYISSITSCI